MRYIISPVTLEKLQDYEMPIKDKYGNRDVQAFYNTEKGKEFLNIEPLYIWSFQNREDCFENILNTLDLLHNVYNCTLYLYVMSESVFHKYLKLDIKSHSNLNMLKLVLEKGFNHPSIQQYIKPVDNSYLRVDFLNNKSVFYNMVLKNLEVINLKERPIWSFKITVENGIEKI